MKLEILTFVLLAAGCTTPQRGSTGTTPSASSSGNASAPAPTSEPGACRSDDDCVPASCCHAVACVSKRDAPVCQGVMCNMMCVPRTIDCGGGCACTSG